MLEGVRKVIHQDPAMLINARITCRRPARLLGFHLKAWVGPGDWLAAADAEYGVWWGIRGLEYWSLEGAGL